MRALYDGVVITKKECMEKFKKITLQEALDKLQEGKIIYTSTSQYGDMYCIVDLPFTGRTLLKKSISSDKWENGSFWINNSMLCSPEKNPFYIKESETKEEENK